MRKFACLISTIACTLCINAQSLRVNSIGYLCDDVKVAVYVGNTDPADLSFNLASAEYGVCNVDSVVATEPWAPAKFSARIYFSSTVNPGKYTLNILYNGQVTEVISLYIGDDAYSRYALNELPLFYLRQQRCGYNPIHNETCHQHDGILVMAGDRTGEHVDVTGGWHDASDYLQYLTTSLRRPHQEN